MTLRAQLAQGKEDRILRSVFARIGVTNKHAVEFGAMDGMHHSNTAYWRRAHGWTTTLFDAAPLSPMVIQARIDAENVNDLFRAHGVPRSFDLLSIDIDGNDLWVWQALTFRPRVVVIEYNPRWGANKSRTVPYDTERHWDGTNYYGASVLALWRLGREKGYRLVRYTRSNLVFVLDKLRGAPRAIRPGDVRRVHRGKRADPLRRKWEVYP